MHVCIHLIIYIYICVCVHTYIYIYIYIYIYMCVCVCVCVCVCMHLIMQFYSHLFPQHIFPRVRHVLVVVHHKSHEDLVK